MMYKFGAMSHTHVFKWFKDSERDVRTLMMIQVVGSYQVLEIQKVPPPQKKILVRDHQMTHTSREHKLGNNLSGS